MWAQVPVHMNSCDDLVTLFNVTLFNFIFALHCMYFAVNSWQIKGLKESQFAFASKKLYEIRYILNMK